MWVWRSLGCQAAELPSSVFAPLGRRCCQDGADTSASLPMEYSTGNNWSIDSLSTSLKDSKGIVYRLGPGKSEGVAAWRLEPFNDLRLCVPAAVEVQSPPAISVTEISERTDNRNPIFKSVKDAVKKLISRGGGTFLYHVPIATVRLREEADAVVTGAPGEVDWPECVSGAVVGVALKVAIMLGPQTTSTALPSIVPDPDESRAVNIDCETCRICVAQKGGPPLDPAKLHGRHEEGIAQELEIWAKRARNKLNTWRLLYIQAQAANVDGPSRLAIHSAPQILQSLGRQLGDLVLAAVADIEFCIEPFEISYGESHLESLRCMVAEEIANLLGISSDQVMCGSFKLKSVIPKRRHVRRNSMMLQIALLHQGLIQVVRGPQMPTRQAADPLPELVSKKAPRLTKSATTKMWTDPLNDTAEPTSPTGTKKSIALTRALTTLKDTQEAFSQTMRDTGLNKSSSEPSLTKSKSLFDRVYAKGGSFPSKDMPPDQLLKTLMHILGDTTHPIRKHPQIFPMFARISKQAVVVRAPLVASQDIIDPERMAESIRELMKPRRVKSVPSDVDGETLENLSTMRTEILSLYSQPGGSIAVQKSQLVNLTPKEILDMADSTFGQMHALVACLEAMIEKTENDTEYCQRLCLHHAVDRTLVVMRHFTSSREVVFRGLRLIRNLTVHDILSVDAILQHSLAPDLMLSLDNFPSDQEVQQLACQILRRVYIRARENTIMGSRVVTLGKQLDEVWTFHGLSRVLTSMKLFQENADIQLEGCMLLASIGEVLYNNGYATEVFKLLETGIRKHAGRADLLCQTILIISRLGSSFLSLEPRGIQTIVDAMARHRLDRNLQMTAVRALFTLAKDELALQSCRAGGGAGAILSAMAAHPDTAQILQEGTRALEKHCPRAVAKITRLCGDIACLLPPATWTTGPDQGTMQVRLDVEELKATGWAARGIENLVVEFNPPTNSLGQQEEDLLHLDAGFRKKKGLRDDIDAADHLWMSIGKAQVAMPRGSSSHNIRQKDINALSQLGCDVEVLRQPGPKRDQVRRLCEVLKEGVGPKKYSAQDGELLILLLGHFAWFSHTHAREIIEFGGHTSIVEWLTTKRFKGQANALDDALAFPLHRACLCTLASICRHGIDTSNHVLELDGVELALQFATHLEAGVRCCALRLLARLISYAAKRHPQKDSLPLDSLWPIILVELRSNDELLRTVAGACALEAIANGCVPVENGNSTVPQSLALALLNALELAADADSSAAALPLLIAVNRMAGDEDELIHGAMRKNESLIPLMTDWLPKATRPMAVATAKAAGLSAACTLRLLSDAGAALDGSELAPLLRYGTSVLAEARLQEACKAAIQFSVQREQDAGLLIQMLTGRLKLGSKGEDKIADVGIMIRVAQRATSLIKLDPNQASDALLEALENSEELVPPDVNEARDMQAVLEELQEVIRKSISIRNGEVEEDQEEPGQPECEVEEQTQQT